MPTAGKHLISLFSSHQQNVFVHFQEMRNFSGKSALCSHVARSPGIFAFPKHHPSYAFVMYWNTIIGGALIS
jgi:hypothetical protein